MSGYRKNKFLTALDIVREIENWWTGWDLRLRRRFVRPELLRFRNGQCLVCRGGTKDWDVVQEVFFVGAYAKAIQYLSRLQGEPTVVDLGANIGTFSQLAAKTNPNACIRAYEPGPPNFDLFEVNRRLNPASAARISVSCEAVGGAARKAVWFFDAANPGGSGIYANSPESFPVNIRAIADILNEIPGQVALLKIDIEGSEYELLESMSPELWQRVAAVVIEIHDDPRGLSSPDALVKLFHQQGFSMEREKTGCYFFHRPPSS